MTKSVSSTEGADAIWRAWMTRELSAAAETFDLTLTGSLAWGWRDRSVGARAAGLAGPCWLRVVSEDLRWAHGDWWTGNTDANEIDGITKPIVLNAAEWEQGPRRVRAEVMTLVPGHPCSTEAVLTQDLRLPRKWWSEMFRSLDAVAATPTSRECLDSVGLADRIRSRLGVAVNPRVVRWNTVHGDLHWANLCEPQFAILDWEWWGRGPAGLDAATLYCYSLLAPATAQRVYNSFRGTLSTPQGAIVQLYACARLLSRVERGDHPELAPPLRRHAEQLARTVSA